MGLIKRKGGPHESFNESKAKAAKMSEDEILVVLTAEDANKLPAEVVRAYNERLHELQKETRMESDVHRLLAGKEGDEPVKHKDIYPERIAGSATTKELISTMAAKIEAMPEAMATAFAQELAKYLKK